MSLLYKEMRSRAIKELMDENEGIPIWALAPDSPSARAGVQPGDLITKVNGKITKNIDDFFARGKVDEITVLRVEMSLETMEFETKEHILTFTYTEEELESRNDQEFVL